jgi:hypothetical protein
MWAQDGKPDYVNDTDSTDQNPDSIGRGMAFLSWLISQNYTLDIVAQGLVTLGAGGTLADLYAIFSGNSAANAWPVFPIRNFGASRRTQFGRPIWRIGHRKQNLVVSRSGTCELIPVSSSCTSAEEEYALAVIADIGIFLLRTMCAR